MGCWTYYCIKSRRDLRRHCVYVPSFGWLRFSMWVSGVHVQYFFMDDELKLVDMYLLENVRLDNEQKYTMNILNPRLKREIWYSVPVSYDYKIKIRRKNEIIITVIWCLKFPTTRFFFDRFAGYCQIWQKRSALLALREFENSKLAHGFPCKYYSGVTGIPSRLKLPITRLFAY